MVFKNVLAALILVTIIVSFVGTYMVLDSITEEGQKAGTATARVNVIAQPKPPSSLGYVSVNVIEASKGG